MISPHWVEGAWEARAALADLHHTCCKLLSSPHQEAHGQHHMPSTHHYHKDNGAGKTPDEGVVGGDPAEVRVPIAIGVQANSQALGREEVCSRADELHVWGGTEGEGEQAPPQVNGVGSQGLGVIIRSGTQSGVRPWDGQRLGVMA